MTATSSTNAATPAETIPPRWDMTTIFPSLTSPEFQTAFDAAVSGIGALAQAFDAHEVRRSETSDADENFVAAFEAITQQMEALTEQIRTLRSYVGCFTSTDANDDAAQSRESLLNARMVPLDQLQTRYVAWVGAHDVEALLARSEMARGMAFGLRRAHFLARHQMTEAEEALASELRPASITGWARLHGNMSALLTADVTVNGATRTLPLSSVRALSADPDRAVRQAAFEAELKAWEGVAVPFAAALNGVKGFQQTLRRKRGYADDVEPTLTANSIDRATLDAMQTACIEAFPDFRRYLRAKAKKLGLAKLAWHDLNAPVGASVKTWAWPEAEGFIRENFGRYTPRLADFADRAFREQWVDAGPRVGKEGGAYCTGIRGGESRVMMNFDGSFGSVSTLAHELGHAYHNLNLETRTPMQRGTPMTLAETASIFCETLAFEAALARADPDERLTLLDTTLQRDFQVVVDIHSRFLFEQAVFAKRAERDLTPTEFSALMTDAQLQTYGDDVAPLHPYMWAVKGHYYGPTFYNYPYTFGLLFGVGLYAQRRQNPEAFPAKYDALLASTGLADAKTLGAQFGFDTASVAFWRGSLDIIRESIAEFERLVTPS